MLIFRFSKTDGAEFISHLDTMRHIQKTIVRAKMPVAYSQGFNPHMLVYLSPPVFVGLKSVSEYCLVETDENAEIFKEKFNRFSPKGIKCILAFSVSKKHRIAGLINSAEYQIYGVQPFDLNDILGKQEILLTDRFGVTKNVRDRILDLKFLSDETLIARLSFGNTVLRADFFCNYLFEMFGFKVDVLKTEAFVDGVLPEEILN